MVIEPVHCGSSSILKVRFLGHPVVELEDTGRRPEVSDYLITSPPPPVPALFTLCNHLFLNRAGTESVKLDYHRVLVLEQQCLKNQVIQKNKAIEKKKHMILFSLSRSTIVHSRLY